MRTKIKICGITNLDDALYSARAGADALGFIFAASPRKVEPPIVREIIKKLPVFVTPVGVFVKHNTHEINDVARETGIRTIQLHGDYNVFDCIKLWNFGYKVIKVFRIGNDFDVTQVKNFIECTDAFMLDTHVEGQEGGTGKVFNWDIALRIKEYGHPVILSGGLNPDNVADAIKQTSPFAIDLSSGVEAAPGKKDHAKIDLLFKNIQKN